MKKEKALEDLTHKELFETIIYDENIQDNMHVSNDYSLDKYGNSLITMGFQGVGIGKKKGTHAMIIFSFNTRGRMVNMEIATREVGQRKWQVASSEKFVDFTARYGDFETVIDSKKSGN
jgi:hypothetical protein